MELCINEIDIQCVLGLISGHGPARQENNRARVQREGSVLVYHLIVCI